MRTVNEPVADAPHMAAVHTMAGRCAVLAAIGVTVLAACGGSNSTISPGELGTLPAAHGTPVSGGTVTIAAEPGQMPLWILPLTPTADVTTATVPEFDYLMWRPLYWTVNGVEPTVVPSMSLAEPPVWSHGDKTATITMNGYKWSDGQRVSSQDVLFDLDLIEAAIKQNAANWAWYTPGFLPDDIASASTPNASTLVINLRSAVNPTWFEEDELAPPAADAERRLGQGFGGRAAAGFRPAGQREEDLRLPGRSVQVPVHLYEQSALADRGWPLQADLLQRGQRRVFDDRQPGLRRPARRGKDHRGPDGSLHVRCRRAERRDGWCCRRRLCPARGRTATRRGTTGWPPGC